MEAVNETIAPGEREVRVTSRGKIKNYVTVGLTHLKENTGTTIILHTLPSTKTSMDRNGTTAESSQKSQKFPSSTNDIPRLITIAEIIKREFASLVLKNKAGVANPPGTTLYQYNTIATLPDVQLPAGEETDGLLLALEGKNHLKRALVPYMKIYLTTAIREDLSALGLTFQKPLETAKPSKSAKARVLRRARRVAKGDEEMTPAVAST